MNITAYIQEILRNRIGKSESALSIAWCQCKLFSMLVNQVGAKRFAFIVWHAGVSSVIELRAFPPSHSRCKGVHIESDFEGE
eukprot:3805462-Pyramimonas_sp.AAC.1